MPLKDGIRSSGSDRELVASRREHIARCATHVFVKNGYDRTNVDEIADACGMSKGNLYNYVGSKEDILYLVIDRGLTNLTKTIEDLCDKLHNVDPADALREFINTLYRGIGEDTDFTLFTYQETKNLSPTARQCVLDAASRDVAVCEQLLRRGVESGKFKINRKCVNAIKYIQNYKWKKGGEQQPEKIDDHLPDAIRYAIFTYDNQMKQSESINNVPMHMDY